MDLYRQQSANRWLTWLFMGGFVVLFVGVGWAIDLEVPMRADLMLGGRPFELPLAPLGALGFSALSAGFTYFRGDRMVLGTMNARPLDASNPKERQLQNVVEEMAIASGLPMPAVYIVPDDDLNAFATGRSPQHATIGVTEGLLAHMDREELQAVVAHEMGHIRNLDIRTMMVVSVLLGALALLCDMVIRSGGHGARSGSRKQNQGPNPLTLVVVIVAPLIARLLAMAVSRTREFEADRSAAEFTRNPLALARALAKLESAQEPTRIATQGTAHLFIIDPRISKLNAREDWLGNLFATHPPVQARIKRLEAMGYGRHAEVA